MIEPPKMYIFINSDLNMTAGKIASQASHITHQIVEELVRNGYEQFPPSEEYKTYMRWNKNCTKIVLRGTTEQLLELLKIPNSRGFYDNGQTTQGTANSLTVVGFFPCANIDGLDINKFKLL
jgi:peptidyl-tRNA hydrolase